MPEHQVYAKVKRPKFSAILERKRAFSLLDRIRRRYPIVWVNGPPGSGKTVLLSSYIETRKLQHIWYHVDPRDSDVATLFYYMGLAAIKVSPKKTPLPLLTAEYLPALPAFAHNYFEELFSRLKPPSCIVFDNYHEVPSNILFHDVICNGLAVIPHGINIIIISRGAPPSEFSRFMGNDLIATISWEDLRLNYAESVRISRLKRNEAYPARVIKNIYSKTDGWAAGFVLLLVAARKGADMGKLMTITPDTIYDYFNSEIIKKLDRNIYDFLLKTSLLPGMDHEMAKSLTGLRDAGKVLSFLSRNNCFTERRYLHEHVYQYNPLFREYLLLKLAESISAEELLALKKKASSILADSGRYEDALELYRQCSDWEGVIRLVTEQANNLITEGRVGVLEDWIKGIPVEIRNKSPWLFYWLGICRMPFNSTESRGLFKNAFQLFLEQNDVRGTYLSWSGFVDSCCLGLDDLKPLDEWIGKPDQLLRSFKGFPDENIEAIVASRMFMALVYRQPRHPDLDTWGDRALTLSQRCGDTMLKAMTLSNHAFNCIRAGEFERASHYIELYRDMVGTVKVNPLVILMMKWIEAVYLTVTGSHEKCLKVVSEGLSLSEAAGVHVMDSLLMGHGALSSLNEGDFARANNLLRKMGSCSGRLRPRDQGFFNMLTGYNALLHGNYKKAAIYAGEALKQAEDVGFPVAIAICNLENAHVMYGLKDQKKARYYLKKGLRDGRDIGYPYIEFIGQLTMACFVFSQGREKEMLTALRRGFKAGRTYGFISTYLIRPHLLAELCCKALQSGIETEYVQDLVKKRSLMPAQVPVEIECWPWAVRIYTLGRFGLVREGTPVQFSRKSQQKPLEMLKALISLGGRGIRKEQLQDLLWTDVEGDTAHQNFEITLHRLRKLLGVERAI